MIIIKAKRKRIIHAVTVVNVRYKNIKLRVLLLNNIPAVKHNLNLIS